jgi:hypothetical protein
MYLNVDGVPRGNVDALSAKAVRYSVGSAKNYCVGISPFLPYVLPGALYRTVTVIHFQTSFLWLLNSVTFI